MFLVEVFILFLSSTGGWYFLYLIVRYMYIRIRRFFSREKQHAVRAACSSLTCYFNTTIWAIIIEELLAYYSWIWEDAMIDAGDLFLQCQQNVAHCVVFFFIFFRSDIFFFFPFSLILHTLIKYRILNLYCGLCSHIASHSTKAISYHEIISPRVYMSRVRRAQFARNNFCFDDSQSYCYALWEGSFLAYIL